MAPSASITPINGGSPVIALKIGINIRPAIPSINIVVLSAGVMYEVEDLPCIAGSSVSLPSRKNVSITSGTSIETREGKKSCVIKAPVVTFSFIHSIIVVTSPVGVHAPPLLAASITIPQNIHLSLFTFISLRNSIVINIAVVRLSSIADMKKVKNEIIQRSLRLLRVFILSVMQVNPPWTSTSSTIVIAPIR